MVVESTPGGNRPVPDPLADPPRVLSIAGSDPSGGAGIQADLKTFGALGAYGCAVVTSLTAQSTRGVTGVHAVPGEFVARQVDTLAEDVDIDATKIGMLGTVDAARAVAESIGDAPLGPVIVDPVMVSTAGSRLLDEDAVATVRSMIPRVDLITPNLPEAAVLLGLEPTRAATGVEAMREHARRLHDLGARRVLITGGHLPGDQVTDVFFDGQELHELSSRRVDTRHTHGTGCTLSAALAALRPQRMSWLAAATEARDWLLGALDHADRLTVGRGAGPGHHFWRWW